MSMRIAPMRPDRDRDAAQRAPGSVRWSSFSVARELAMASLVPTLVGVLGCVDLPAIERGTCGNRIVEAGEDCDSYEKGFVCRAPGSDFECRFDCTPTDSDPNRTCPIGYGCGSDGVCRSATGELELLGSQATEAPFLMLLADLDGGGTDDIVAAARSGTTVFHTGRDGVIQSSLLLSNLPSVPAVAQLTEDTIADVLLGYLALTGVGVMQGQRDGALLATAYAPYRSEPYDLAYVFAMEAIPTLLGEFASGDELIVYHDSQLTDAFAAAPIMATPRDVTRLAGSPVVGKLAQDLACEQVVLAYRDASAVDVLSPCAGGLGDVRYNHQAGSLEPELVFPSVTLADGATVEQPGARLTLLNDDDQLDLMVFTSEGVQFAFGMGDGHFNSLPILASDAEPDDSTISVDFSLDGPDATLLEATDLNDDGAVDFITPRFIALSTTLGNEVEYGGVANYGTPWDTTLIADFNGDGRRDVVTASTQSTRLQLHTVSAGGEMATYEVQLSGAPHHTALGDFDGNGIYDVVYAREAGDDADQDVLFALFGEPFSVFAPEVSLGRLHAIESLVPMQIPFMPDAIDDLVAVLEPDSKGRRDVAMFFGRTSRRLESPFSFVLDDQDAQVVAVAAGDVDGDEHADVCATTYLTDSGNTRMDLWMVPSTGDAELAADEVRHARLPEDISTIGGRLVSVDLDQDGVSEMLLVGPTLEDPPRGAFTVARFQDDDVVLDDPQYTDEVFLHDSSGQVSLANVGQERPRSGLPGDETDVLTADVDGDGDSDVLALGVDVEQQERVLVVVPNDDGSLDVRGRRVIREVTDGTTTMPLPVPCPFAIIEADADPEPEVAIGLYGQVVVLNLDLESEMLVARRALPMRENNVSDGASSSSAGGAERFTALAAGDVDGDGVEDLAAGTLSGIDVYRGVPTLE